jgi:hypothetical protein
MAAKKPNEDLDCMMDEKQQFSFHSRPVALRAFYR